jgi:hypothetical protein
MSICTGVSSAWMTCCPRQYCGLDFTLFAGLYGFAISTWESNCPLNRFSNSAGENHMGMTNLLALLALPTKSRSFDHLGMKLQTAVAHYTYL